LLRRKYGVKKLSDIGHKMKRLLKDAQTDDDAAVFSLIGDTDVLIEFRYIRTGAKTWPTLEELNRACNNIRNCVGNLLQKNKLPVRL
jgi:hypothetical protein